MPSSRSSTRLFVSLLGIAGCLTDPAQYGPQGGGGGAPTSGGGGAGASQQSGGEGGVGAASGGAGGTANTGGVGGEGASAGAGGGTSGEGLTGGTVKWVETLGPAGDQSFDALAIATDDKIYAGGRWSGSFDVEVRGGACAANSVAPAFVHALTADGATRWTRCFGSDARVAAIDVNASGAIAVAGSFAGNIDVGDGVETSKGMTDVFIVLLAPNGDIVWGETFGSTAADEAQGVALGPGGEVYVSGVFRAAMQVGTTSLTLPTAAGLFRAKFVDEDALWARASPTVGGAPVLHIAIRKNGVGPLVGAGAFAGSIDPDGPGPNVATPSSDAADDAFHMGFEVDGAITSFTVLPGAGKQQALGVVTSNSRIVISGVLEGSADFDGPASLLGSTTADGGSDAFLLFMGFDHVATSLELVPGAGSQRGLAAALPRIGHGPLLLAGDFVAATQIGDALVSAPAGAGDGFFTVHDTAGDPLPSFSRRVGGGGTQIVSAAAFLDGDVVIAGSHTGLLDLDPNLGPAQAHDAFIARISP